MIQFQCDYNEGAHPKILERLIETNMEQTVGYGNDQYCASARKLIRKACDCPTADVHFLVGGTQANATIISSILKPYQCVICAHTAHINVHETGAIEHGGHKCLAIPAHDGLISASQIEKVLKNHFEDDEPEHCVQPGLVYISFSTEYGTLYSSTELQLISEVCHSYDIPLFIDGARMGYGLMSDECDITLPELAQLADVFYLGGTKQGALFGEAVVITNDKLKRDFRYNIKQGGGMLAKGRLLGIQFETLFTDNLYFNLARHANQQAMRIKKALQDNGYPFLIESPTNQQFPILPNELIDELSKDFLFSIWEKVDDEYTCIRICTSWATKPENVDKLIAML